MTFYSDGKLSCALCYSANISMLAHCTKALVVAKVEQAKELEDVRVFVFCFSFLTGSLRGYADFYQKAAVCVNSAECGCFKPA